MKTELLPTLPAIEVIFVCFLFTFIINYYLINGALYKPFIDNAENSYLIKVCGGLAVAIIALFYYSLQFTTLKAALSIFYFGFFAVIIFEMFFMQTPHSKEQILFALGAFVASIITIGSQESTLFEGDLHVTESSIWGSILALVCALLAAMLMINLSKMHKENFASMNHIFSMMVVLFVPVFFPIQGVVKPSMAEWGILVLMGVMTTIAVLAFIRGFQLENPGNVSIIVLLSVALGFLISMVLGSASGFIAMLGSVAVIVCLAMFSKITKSRSNVS
mmetsp:Transcript_28298/g.25079  ORF Transcript_28298/g.25079 Transcript_28298/m.25079 type:complete len:276 (-) Transcript_28298:433-1260(-)